MQLLLRSIPGLLGEHYKRFFCSYAEPAYIKRRKMQVVFVISYSFTLCVKLAVGCQLEATSCWLPPAVHLILEWFWSVVLWRTFKWQSSLLSLQQRFSKNSIGFFVVSFYFAELSDFLLREYPQIDQHLSHLPMLQQYPPLPALGPVLAQRRPTLVASNYHREHWEKSEELHFFPKIICLIPNCYDIETVSTNV